MNAPDEHIRCWLVTLPHEESLALQQAAARLYPRDLSLQAEWVRAIRTVRSTSRGWVLDRPITRERRND